MSITNVVFDSAAFFAAITNKKKGGFSRIALCSCDGPALNQLARAGEIDHVVQGAVKRAQVRIDLLSEIARRNFRACPLRLPVAKIFLVIGEFERNPWRRCALPPMVFWYARESLSEPSKKCWF